VSVGIGRFGPYVKHGSAYVSIKTDDPYTIDFPRALELIAEKKAADAAKLIKDFGDGIIIQNGRFGAYLTDGARNARIPKDRDPASLTLAECQELLKDAPLRGTKRFGRKGTTKAAAVAKPTAKKAAASAPKGKTAAKKPAVAKTAKPKASKAKAGAVKKKTATAKKVVKKAVKK